MDFSILNLIWIFFIISSLLPAIQKRMLQAARLRLMRELEKKRDSRVIALIHRQETMALLGFPIFRYIDIDDSEEVLRAIKLTDDEVPVDLILHTPGGLVLASEQIAHALCRHPAKVTIFVPHYAMSGGTLLALAADEIVMDENAVLGPVDPQVGEWPAASILRIMEQKSIDEIDDKTLVLADVARKAVAQVRARAESILAEHLPDERAQELARTLSEGRWTHDYPITVEEAQELGLPVSTDMPEEVYKLMTLYQQPGQRRPSVQYIPVPYHPERGRERGQE
jgi:ClpP class serine protease